jgi:hypothetical protein
MPLASRINNLQFSWDSSSFMIRVTLGWLLPKAAAALVIFPYFAT